MKSWVSTVLLILTLGCAPAWAALGAHESSVAADEKALHGEDRQESRTGYTLHQITAPNGMVVKEFVSPAGIVFGVTWQAPQMPNLQQLLGSSLADLQTALQTQPRRHGRGPMIVQTHNLVLVSGGHMRSFHGYAYVPGLMPHNVSPEVLQ